MRDPEASEIAVAAYEQKAMELSKTGRVAIRDCQAAAQSAVLDALSKGTLTRDTNVQYAAQAARQAHESVVDRGKRFLFEHAETQRAAGLPAHQQPCQQVFWRDIQDQIIPLGEGGVRVIRDMDAQDWLAALVLYNRNTGQAEDAENRFMDHQYSPAVSALNALGGGTTADAISAGILV